MAIHYRILDCFAALAMTVALLFANPAAAQTFPERGRSPVVDQADLLRPEQEVDLTSKSEALFAQTGRQFVVATVNSLEGQEIEDYGYRLGRHWGIGSAEEDDGVILLVAPNEKKVRIETGYGAEGFLPDILAGRIIRNDILPRFRAGDMAGGIMTGADAIIGQMQLPPGEAQERARQAEAEEARARDSEGLFAAPLVMGGLIFLFVILGMARRAGGRRYHRHGKRGRRRRGFDAGDAAIILWGLSELAESAGRRGRGGWGGGGGFGGFGGGGGFGGFSGGGGGFGGGGASGGW